MQAFEKDRCCVSCMHHSTGEHSIARESRLLVQIINDIAACMQCNAGEHDSALDF